MRTTVRSILETATNVALLIVCGVIVWLLIKNHDQLLHGKTQTASAAELMGTDLAPIPDYKWTDHDKTLLLALQMRCRFCEASMPFYHRLSELQQTRQLHAYLLAVMPDENQAAIGHLRSNGVDIPCACGHLLSSIHVSGTPTLLLVDRKGRVEQAWVGQLPPTQENQVITELEK